MGKETRTKLYIGSVLVGATSIAAIATLLWPVQWTAASLLTSLMVMGLVILAARFPFKLSPQAEASLFTVPLFMAVLLLHPSLAMIAAAAAVLVTDVQV